MTAGALPHLRRHGLAVGIMGLAPGGALGVIDLAQAAHLRLHDAAVVEAFVFDHTPVSVFPAVFLANL